MKDLIKDSLTIKFFLLILCLSLFVGFYFNEDASSGGVSTDFNSTWNYVLIIKENLFSNVGWLESKNSTRVLPLHYIIVSQLHALIPEFTIVSDGRDLLRLFFCLFSLSIPILFYLNLKIKFPNINRTLLAGLSFLIIIIPYFRASAIWANSHITALVFFLLSIFFFLKWEKKNYSKLDLNLVLQCFFLALSVYTRQSYVIFFIYYLFIYLKRLTFVNFTKISILIFLFSLPGFWIIFNFPYYFTASDFTSKFYNTILINSSMIFVYLLPIFTLLIISNIKLIFNEIKFFISSFIFFTFLVVSMSIFFDYNPNYGGGFFLKLSNFLFQNNYLFYISSLIGLVCLSYLSKENVNNLILIILIFISLSLSIIMQKWHEPLFLFMFFLMFHSKLPNLFLMNYKNIFFIYFYFFVYLISAIINDYYQIGANL